MHSSADPHVRPARVRPHTGSRRTSLPALAGSALALALLAPAHAAQDAAVHEEESRLIQQASRHDRQALPATPAQLYGELFHEVQMQRVFGDGKTFVDAVALEAPAEIMKKYEARKNTPGFSLKQFVEDHFELPAAQGTGFEPDARRSVLQHIDALWPYLTRTASGGAMTPGDTLVPLPHDYLIPGGRFREVYYWDSYFTMLGLVDSGRQATAENMVRNFAHLIDTYGHVPNGNRTYYLSRSQPPFFFKMVGALSEHAPAHQYARYLPQLKKEYYFWMADAWKLRPGQASRRVVRMPDGSVLNRYWDDRDTPRDESYREDVLTAQESRRPAREVYRDLRAAAESGWDFSSRWFADGKTLSTIQTTSVVPVDLNSLLYGLETAISEGCAQARDWWCKTAFAWKAQLRKRAMNRYLWSEARGHYVDYQWVRRQPIERLTAATVYPLFVGAADHRQAAHVARHVQESLLKQNGIATTLAATGQQWDLPNGWAPLQWMTIDGLARYHHSPLARDVAWRWMRTVDRVYRNTVKLVEKYDVTTDQPGGGGEYPTQDGFGWTNGVMVRLARLYPDLLPVHSALLPTRTSASNTPARTQAEPVVSVN